LQCAEEAVGIGFYGFYGVGCADYGFGGGWVWVWLVEPGKLLLFLGGETASGFVEEGGE
jgi:hypothetical protein